MGDSRPETVSSKIGDDRLPTSSGTLVVRLFLVRHGETESNAKKIVVGQGDSPLSERGEEQSKVLASDDIFRKESFHRAFTSDLGRTKQTANLLAPSLAFELEPRLREMAKGAREGLPKSMSYEEAMERRKGDEIPLLETNEDVWLRLKEWLLDLIGNCVAQHQASCQETQDKHTTTVLAITHAGVLRTLCARLVPSQLPRDIDISDMGKDGSHSRHMKVPNTSVTILELEPKSVNDEVWKPTLPQERLKVPLGNFIHANLRVLTYHDHHRQIKDL